MTTNPVDVITTRTISDTEANHRALGALQDRQHYVRRWVNTWVALGAGVVLVICAYLLVISNALAAVNSNLGVAQQAVADSAGNAKTLPGQLAAVNGNLRKIDSALAPLPEQAGRIQSSLRAIRSNADTTSTSLARTAPRLRSVADHLGVISSTLQPAASGLADTSTLLRQLLSSTGGIKADLIAVNGVSSSKGMRGLSSKVPAVANALAGTESDLGNVLSRLGSVNGHLKRVCTSAPINLLHGTQKC